MNSKMKLLESSLSSFPKSLSSSYPPHKNKIKTILFSSVIVILVHSYIYFYHHALIAQQTINKNKTIAFWSAKPKPSLGGYLSKELMRKVVIGGIDLMNKYVANISVDDVNTTETVKLLGNVQVNLTNTIIRSIKAPTNESKVELHDGWIVLHVHAIEFQLETDFHYHQIAFPHWTGRGHLNVSGLSRVRLVPVFDTTREGMVHMDILDVHVSLSDLKLHFSDSKASWIYNLLSKFLKKLILNAVQNKLTDIFHTTLPNLANDVFGTMPAVVTIMDYQLNVTFAQHPLILSKYIYASNYLLVQENGAICPFAYTDDVGWSEEYDSINSDAIFVVHERFLNCFGWAAFKRGLLSLHISPDDVGEHKQALDTKTWEPAVPAFKENYPQGKLMHIEIQSSKPPLIHINDEYGFALNHSQVQVCFQDEENGEKFNLFCLELAIQLALKIQASHPSPSDNGHIYGELTFADVQVFLMNSAVGKIDMQKVEFGFKLAVGALTDKIMDWLDAHSWIFPVLPVVKLNKLELIYKDETIWLKTNVDYNGHL